MSENEKHIIINGEIASSSIPSIFHNNLSFLHGDGLHETMHVYGTEIQFVDSHFQRLYKGLKSLKININENWHQQKITREIARLLNRDKIFGGAYVSLVVYREEKHDFGYSIAYNLAATKDYQLNQKGLTIGIFKNIPKPAGFLSEFPTNNGLLNVIADNFAGEADLDDVLLVNYTGNIIESTHSNIFIVSGNKVYTPSIDEGCIAGIMRAQVLNIAKTESFETFSNCIISEKNILEADEIFLTNAVEGIKWVQAFKQRRYFNKTAKLFCEKINDIAFKGI